MGDAGPWCPTLAVWGARCLAPLAILWLFFPTLVGESQLAFRDVSHFYTPLYQYVAERTAAEALPLWNPLDATGTPLLGETTTAILYPPRYLLFSLPFPTEIAIGWYVVLHLLLACAFANAAARWCGVSRLAATLAGTTYALSGCVLFLYSNLPFLVSAAWMPLVLGAAWGRHRRIGAFRVPLISLSWAMMILGGDPQTALHAGMIAGLPMLFQFRREYRRVAVLGVAAFLAVLLTLPQIIASSMWSAHSHRAAHDETSTMWSAPPVGSQQHDAFQFSVAPWHLLEMFSPNISGDLFPIFRRLSVLLPGDGRMWTPSLYTGVVVVLAIAAAVRFRRLDRWLVTAILSAFLVLGHFGIGWVLRIVSPSLAQMDPAWGGPYWWLYHFFPGYDVFRYPAKWLPFLALASSIIAAGWLDRVTRDRSATSLRTVIALAAFAVAGWVALAVLMAKWQPPIPLPADRFWGPLDLSGALHRTQVSLLHTLVVLGILAMILIWLRRLPARSANARIASRGRTLAATAIIVVTTGELALAARHWIALADRDLVKAAVASVDEQRPATRWLRTKTGGGFPSAWRENRSPERLNEVEVSQQLARFGRWHVAEPTAVFNNMVSIRSQVVVAFWDVANHRLRQSDVEHRQRLWQEIRRWLSIDGTLSTSQQSRRAPIGERVLVIADVTRKVDVATAGPIQLHHHWTARKKSEVHHDMQRILQRLSDAGANSPPEVFGVDIESRGVAPAPGAGAVVSDVQDEVETATLRIATAAPVLVTRPVLQDGSWRATLVPTSSERTRAGDNPSTVAHSVPVYPVDLLKQGVLVPPGDWEVRFEYRPTWLIPTLLLAALAWLGWLGHFIRSLTSHHGREIRRRSVGPVRDRAADASSTVRPEH